MGNEVHVHMVDSNPYLESAIKTLESLSPEPISMYELEDHGLDQHFEKISSPGHHFFVDTTSLELVCAVRIQWVLDLLSLLVIDRLNRPWSDVVQQEETFLALKQIMEITELMPIIKSNAVCVNSSARESSANHDHIAVSDTSNGQGSTRRYA
jgi:hypothetical protein